MNKKSTLACTRTLKTQARIHTHTHTYRQINAGALVNTFNLYAAVDSQNAQKMCLICVK